MGLTEMPNELLVKIMKYLEPHEVARLIHLHTKLHAVGCDELYIHLDIPSFQALTKFVSYRWLEHDQEGPVNHSTNLVKRITITMDRKNPPHWIGKAFARTELNKTCQYAFARLHSLCPEASKTVLFDVPGTLDHLSFEELAIFPGVTEVIIHSPHRRQNIREYDIPERQLYQVILTGSAFPDITSLAVKHCNAKQTDELFVPEMYTVGGTYFKGRSLQQSRTKYLERVRLDSVDIQQYYSQISKKSDWLLWHGGFGTFVTRLTSLTLLWCKYSLKELDGILRCQVSTLKDLVIYLRPKEACRHLWDLLTKYGRNLRKIELTLDWVRSDLFDRLTTAPTFSTPDDPFNGPLPPNILAAMQAYPTPRSGDNGNSYAAFHDFNSSPPRKRAKLSTNGSTEKPSDEDIVVAHQLHHYISDPVRGRNIPERFHPAIRKLVALHPAPTSFTPKGSATGGSSTRSGRTAKTSGYPIEWSQNRQLSKPLEKLEQGILKTDLLIPRPPRIMHTVPSTKSTPVADPSASIPKTRKLVLWSGVAPRHQHEMDPWDVLQLAADNHNDGGEWTLVNAELGVASRHVRGKERVALEDVAGLIPTPPPPADPSPE